MSLAGDLLGYEPEKQTEHVRVRRDRRNDSKRKREMAPGKKFRMHRRHMRKINQDEKRCNAFLKKHGYPKPGRGALDII